MHLLGCERAFGLVTRLARGHHISPAIAASATQWQNVLALQLVLAEHITAVCAEVAITPKQRVAMPSKSGGVAASGRPATDSPLTAMIG